MGAKEVRQLGTEIDLPCLFKMPLLVSDCKALEREDVLMAYVECDGK